ncbi:MAG: DUF2794 domain-containing protein [Alphaproteobacteria bacterium]|nr:DUF2794 domain-containing protein [Alphaproteobacteria bacterium]
MNQLVRISDYRRKASALHFTRSELTQLLGVYSSRVITGEWRDYAIGATPGFARFCIYRSSREDPLFTITKLATDGKARSALARKGKYVVSTRQRTLRQSHSLLDVLEIFKSDLKLLSH